MDPPALGRRIHRACVTGEKRGRGRDGLGGLRRAHQVPAPLYAVPGIDVGEITDKGNVNQRQVLANRAALVELLYTEPVLAGVVVAGRTA